MGKGHEYLHRINTVLNEFEQAVIHREHRKPFTDRVPLQQEVDRAREHVVKAIVDLVTEARVANVE